MTLMERGIIIKEARKAKNFSTEQMADFMEMSDQTYKKIETGEKDPTTQEVNKLINLLELDPSLFYAKNVFMHCDNSNGVIGYGNTISIDKEYMEVLKLSIENSSAAMKHIQNIEPSVITLASNISDLVLSVKTLVELQLSK
jgi:transcriptional regulator with XRE-family HTH domain